MATQGHIHSIEPMGTVDGPGTRCVIFAQGCPIRCIYCHNPDSWKTDGGRLFDTDELMQLILRYKPYFGSKGGVTFSGGEPLLQPEFVGELFEKCCSNKIHTALDTAGMHVSKPVIRVLDSTDLVLLDIKHAKPDKFKEITGSSIDNLLEFLDYICDVGIEMWVRQVIVPGINDNTDDIRALAEMLVNKPNLKRIELLPYHTMGVGKWKTLGIKYPLDGTSPLTEEEIAPLLNILKGYNLPTS